MLPGRVTHPRGVLAPLAAAIDAHQHELLSTDLFDTVLLRDRTTESERFAEVGRRAATVLGVDAEVLTRLRWTVHDAAYRAVAMERPGGEASLAAISATVAASLGLGDGAARVLRHAEVDVDAGHLAPHRALLALLERAARAGTRVVAVSDTWYGRDDLARLLDTVVGEHPIAAIHASSELGLTKHAGGLFAEVARREGVDPSRILHVGDHGEVDVRAARAASWRAVHVPRGRRHRAARLVGRATALPTVLRRAR